ncbi:hypothetical protein HLRTI_002895 [Halorhabdus tiamatea SARL4B]|uniref:Uncharacterized protein n=1 Tax=Halorhabdus tiamatea SARL4B TaxID=1033806 RepID=U2DZ83_9EURY|nr:hypothetical protein [Halorhabdus tiamatea]ERJ05096.1 hypothetical protein HLRTI_002895 [Halorhabdus tiamatea SARL4B]
MTYTEIAGGYAGGDSISIGVDDEDSAEYVLIVSGPDNAETCIRFGEIDRGQHTLEFYRRVRAQPEGSSKRVKTGQIEKWAIMGDVREVIGKVARGGDPQP